MLSEFVNLIMTTIKKPAQKDAAQIALLLLNAQRLTIAVQIFEIQLKKINDAWSAAGYNGTFEISGGVVILKPKQKSK